MHTRRLLNSSVFIRRSQPCKKDVDFINVFIKRPHSTCIKERFVGQVVKASASGVEDLGLESCLQRDFSGSRHTSDLKIGTPVAARSLALQGQRWDWSAQCQYTVTG